MTAVRGRRRAVAAAGLLLWALPAGAAAQAPPAAPEDLEADVESDRVRLTWDAGEADNRLSAVRFRIFRDGDAIGTSSDEDHVDRDVAPGERYAYVVVGIDILGREGEESDPLEVSIPGGDPPGRPVNLVAEAVSDSRIDLAWDPAGGEVDVAGYHVYRDDSSQPDFTGGTGYDDTGLDSYREYTYRVAAVSTGGVEGPHSDPASARTADGSPPTTPGDFTADATGAGRVELAWSSSEDPESGVSEYRIYRNDELLGTSPGVGFVDLTVEPETTLEYRVSAVNGDGVEGQRTDAEEVTTPPVVDTVPPAPPTDLRVVGR